MKKILRTLKKRGSSGFTLVEMIVSVALLAILLGGMMLFVAPIVRSFNDTKTNMNAENVATTMQEYLTRSIRNAHQVAVFSYIGANDLEDNSAIKAKIDQMGEFCKARKNYMLKCISLRYEDGKYVMYNENVDLSGTTGVKIKGTGTKVFSDCLSTDLYFTYDIRKTVNQEYGDSAGEPMYRNDAIEVVINGYSDSEYTNLVFSGSGVSDLRQIRVMRTIYKGSSEVYNLTTIPDNPDSTGKVLSFGDFDDAHKNIYIFYAVRSLGDVVTS